MNEEQYSSSATRDRVNGSRRRKWVRIQFLHTVLHTLPYRYHSIDRALEATPGPGYCVSRTAFVARMMAEYHFDRRLRMDAHLKSLYGCFEGATTDSVDYRDILCCMTFLRRYKEVRGNPSQLFRDLVLMYADQAGTLVRRTDVLRVCRMGAVDEGQVWQTSSRLDRYLAEEAHPQGLKRTFRDVPLTLLVEVMESNPAVLVAFRKQLWQRLPGSWRMGVLAAVESFVVDKAGSGALAMKLRRAARWYAQTLSRRMVAGWKIFRNMAKLIRAQRAAVEMIFRRQAIHAWRDHAIDSAKRRKQYPVAVEYGRLKVLRRYFKRMVGFVVASKRVKLIVGACSAQGKLVLAGGGLLREAFRKRSMRLALHMWCETASLMNAWEFAVDLWAERVRRKVFVAYRDIVKAAVIQQQIEDEMDSRAAKIAETFEEVEREKVLLAETAKLAAQNQKTQAKAALMAERAATHKAQQEAVRAASVARDNKITEQQRVARQHRVHEERVRMRQQFEAEWEIRFKELVDEDMEKTKKWLESSDKEAIYKIQKELKILKRKFYAAPLPETKDLEKALSDPANVIFAHMAHQLYEKSIGLRAFFTAFDKEDDGYLAHEEFKHMVASLNIKLSGEQIRSVIRSIDLDGGGFIDFPEFEAAVKRHEEVCGAAGSTWKMYVSPTHAIMILHNVETSEELWDYKAKDSDLKRVVKDNIVGLEGIMSKTRVSAEHELAWENLQKDRAAMVLQRMYRVRAARKKRTLVRWKWDMEMAKLKSKGTSDAAVIIQCWWRVMRAKWLALQLLLVTIEVLWDPGLNQKYYFNHGLGNATWGVPSMLTRWRGLAARMPDIPEWVQISRVYGQSYYYNTRSRLRRDEKPPGYVRCFSCQRQLASKRCTVERRDLCFVCYRREHLDGDEACCHDWEPSKVYLCKVCKQQHATVACLDCNAATKASDDAEGAGGLVLCGSCWDRTHRQEEKFRHHHGATVEEWAMSKGGVGQEERSDLLLGWGAGLEEKMTVSGLVEGRQGYEWDADSDIAGDGYIGAEQFGHEPIIH